MQKIQRAAVIGAGVIGAGWVARLLENGIDVDLFDNGPGAEKRITSTLDNCRHAYAQLEFASIECGELHIHDSLENAVRQATIIIESVPEDPALKQSVYRQVEAAADPDALITSSTSGLLPSQLQVGMQHPQRFLVAHPFVPVYLIPLVELVAGDLTSAASMQHAHDFFTQLGMKPLRVKKEIDAFIADRLLEAIWREALWLVHDGIATTEDIDDAVRYGFGLRYAQMGIFDTYRIGGGDAGMRSFLSQFGPCLEWPWSKLTDVPVFDDKLIELIAGQSDRQSGHLSISEMERIRDQNLVGILRALQANDWGAGSIVKQHQARRRKISED